MRMSRGAKSLLNMAGLGMPLLQPFEHCASVKQSSKKRRQFRICRTHTHTHTHTRPEATTVLHLTKKDVKKRRQSRGRRAQPRRCVGEMEARHVCANSCSRTSWSISSVSGETSPMRARAVNRVGESAMSVQERLGEKRRVQSASVGGASHARFTGPADFFSRWNPLGSGNRVSIFTMHTRGECVYVLLVAEAWQLGLGMPQQQTGGFTVLRLICQPFQQQFWTWDVIPSTREELVRDVEIGPGQLAWRFGIGVSCHSPPAQAQLLYG